MEDDSANSIKILTELSNRKFKNKTPVEHRELVQQRRILKARIHITNKLRTCKTVEGIEIFDVRFNMFFIEKHHIQYGVFL